MNSKNFLLLLTMFLIVVSSLNYLFDTFKSLYYLSIRQTDEVLGLVNEILKVDDIEARTYTYHITYSVSGKDYYFSEVISPYPLKVSVNELVHVKYSKIDPAYATLKTKGLEFRDLSFAFVIIVVEIGLGLKVLKAIREWQLKSKVNNEESNN